MSTDALEQAMTTADVDTPQDGATSLMGAVTGESLNVDAAMASEDVDESFQSTIGMTEDERYTRQQARSLDGFVKYLGDQMSLGANDVYEGMVYSHALQSDAKFAEIEDKLKIARSRAQATENRVSIFEDEVFKDVNPFLRFIGEIPGAVARSSAFTGSVLAGGAALGGATAAASMNPVGFGVGFGVGAFSTAGAISTGLSYRDMRRKKISHNTAVPLAVASGGIQAVIENLQLRQLKTLGKKAYDVALKSPEGQAAIKGTLMRFFKDAGVQGLEEGSQELTQITAEMTGVLIDMKRLPTERELQEAGARVVDSIKGGVQAGVGFTVGAKVTGRLAGTYLRLAKGDAKTVDGLAAVAEELQASQKTESLQGVVSAYEEAVAAEQEKEATTKPKQTDTKQISQEAADEVEQELSRLKRQDTVKKLTGEIDQISRDLNDTQAKLNRRVAENKAELKEGKRTAEEIEKRNPTKFLETRLERLEQAREDAQLLRWGLDNDVLSMTEVRKLLTQTSGRKLNALADYAVKRIFRVGRKVHLATKKNVQANQKYLKRLISKSGLSKEDQARFTTAIIRGDLSEVQDIQAKIDKLLERRARQAGAQRIKTLLQTTRKKEQSGLQKGTLSIPAQAWLNTYRYLFKTKVDDVLKAYDDLLASPPQTEATEPGGLSREETLAAMADVIDVYTGASGDVHAFADRLEQIIETGKDERTAQVEKRKARLQENAQHVIEGIRGTKRHARLDSLNNIMRYLTETKRIGVTKGWFNTFTADIATILQHTADTAHKAYALLDISKEDRERTANTARFNQQLFDKLTDDGSGKRDKKLVRTILKGTEKKKRRGFIDRVSDNELIQLWMQVQDPRLYEGLEATYNVSRGALLGRLESMLSADQLELGRRLQEFYQDYYNRVNEKHIELYSYPLRRNPQYSGRAIRIGADQHTTYTDFLESLQHNKSVVPASLRVSRGGKLQLRTSDAFANAMGHIEAMESWRAFAEKAVEFEHYFAPGSMAVKLIERKFGTEYFQRFQRKYRRIIGLERMPARSKFIDNVRGNYGMYMTGNFTQYLKQSTGLLIYLNYVSPAELLAGINDYIDNFETASKQLASTDFMVMRHNNVTPEQKAALSGLANDLGDGFTWSRFFTLPVSQTDYVVNSLGMWAIYKAELKRGATDAEAMESASRAADESQSSGLTHQKTTVELEFGSLGQLAGTLAKQSTQVSNLETSAWRRALSTPTWTTIGKALQSTISIRTAQAAFGAAGAASAIATAAVFGDDDGEDLSNAWYNAITDFMDNLLGGGHIGLPMFGPALKAMLTATWNWQFDADRKVWEPSAPMMDALFEWGQLAVEFTKDGTSSVLLDEVDLLEFWHAWNRSGAALMPPQARAMIGLDPIIKVAIWLLKDPEYEKQKKRMRKRGESPAPVDVNDDNSDTRL